MPSSHTPVPWMMISMCELFKDLIQELVSPSLLILQVHPLTHILPPCFYCCKSADKTQLWLLGPRHVTPLSLISYIICKARRLNADKAGGRVVWTAQWSGSCDSRAVETLADQLLTADRFLGLQPTFSIDWPAAASSVRHLCWTNDWNIYLIIR